MCTTANEGKGHGESGHFVCASRLNPDTAGWNRVGDGRHSEKEAPSEDSMAEKGRRRTLPLPYRHSLLQGLTLIGCFLWRTRYQRVHSQVNI